MKNEERLKIVFDALQDAQFIVTMYPTISLSKVREALDHTRRATCALQAIECNLSGMPEPVIGE